MRHHYSTRWLFKILDYEHWAVKEDGEIIGQVVINWVDRDVCIVEEDPDVVHEFGPQGMSFRKWVKWVAENEEVDSAFGAAF
jgi:hypothetical protein